MPSSTIPPDPRCTCNWQKMPTGTSAPYGEAWICLREDADCPLHGLLAQSVFEDPESLPEFGGPAGGQDPDPQNVGDDFTETGRCLIREGMGADGEPGVRFSMEGMTTTQAIGCLRVITKWLEDGAVAELNQ